MSKIHSEPARWSFEAQLSFMTAKAAALRQAQVARQSVVVDRSIFEDREVMARSWGERYWDEGARQTYEQAAELLTRDLALPDAVLYCGCCASACAERRSERGRSEHQLYDDAWVQRIAELYEDWVNEFSACPLLEVDTEDYDVRDPEVVAAIVADLGAFLRPPDQPQASLFDEWGRPQSEPVFAVSRSTDLTVLKRRNSVGPTRPGSLPVEPARVAGNLGIYGPFVYLAAPFTAKADFREQEGVAMRLPIGDREHGEIPGEYRRHLQRIATAVEKAGLPVVLPHRDVNKWGRRSMAPSEVAVSCVELVRESAGFVGLIGESYGSHIEAGVAVALGKPCLFVNVHELGATFVGRGLTASREALSVEVPGLDGVARALDASEAFESFADRIRSAGRTA